VKDVELTPWHALSASALVLLDCNARGMGDFGDDVLPVLILVLFMAVVAVAMWRRRSAKDLILRELSKAEFLTGTELRDRGVGGGIYVLLGELQDEELVFIHHKEERVEELQKRGFFPRNFYALTLLGRRRAEELGEATDGDRS
jgi:hypothetical protein